MVARDGCRNSPRRANADSGKLPALGVHPTRLSGMKSIVPACKERGVSMAMDDSNEVEINGCFL